MGLEILTAKEFKKYKDIIDFLAKFGLTIEDLQKLKELKVYKTDESQPKTQTTVKPKGDNEHRRKDNIEKPTTPNDVMEAMFGSGEKEAFNPNAR